MARIRTIKPDFFRHEGLYDLEQETGLPIRVAFAGLWTECDREGRFEWRPRRLKAAILPYDDLDFSRVLDALATRGFLVRYACPEAPEDETRDFGCIPSWKLHQIPNNREKDSEIPPLTDACPTRAPRVPHATSVEQEQEGNRKGTDTRVQPCSVREGPPLAPPTVARIPIPKTDQDLQPFFEAYCRGSGQRLTWRAQHFLPTERIASHGAAPQRVEAAARLYASTCSAGITPSYQRFASDFDRWQAELDRPKPVSETPGRGRQRDDPRLGAPSAARASHGWCKIHQGRAASGPHGLCEQCRDGGRGDICAAQA